MMAAGTIQVPQITREELFAFHQSHFSPRSVRDFHDQFLTAKKATDEGAAAAQPLGNLYDAGYGEVQQCDLALGPIDLSTADFGDDTVAISTDADGDVGEDGEAVLLPRATEDSSEKTSARKKRRRKKNNGTRWAEEKPDLRKRTWDVVDKGLGSLDYDGQENASKDTCYTHPRRQRIQYGDD